MEQILIVLAVVGLAIGYIARKFYRKYKLSKQPQCRCGGGCAGCGPASSAG